MQYKDQLVTFKLGGPVFPGITSVPATWHTPGLSAFKFKSPADAGAPGPFIFGADAVNHKILSVEHPTILHIFDASPYRARRGRVKLLKKVAKRRARVLFSHAQFPGLGGVSVEDHKAKTFRWHPVY